MTRPNRLALLTWCLLATGAFAQANADAPPDERGAAKLKRFIEILTSTEDMEAAGKTVVAEKLVHGSKLDKNEPTKLNNDSMRFAFKKAFTNAKMYDPGPRIIRTQLTATSAVGFGPTAQKGKLYKYFIAKKEGVGGMPAPIQIFYPEDGSDPIVYDFGSF